MRPLRLVVLFSLLSVGLLTACTVVTPRSIAELDAAPPISPLSAASLESPIPAGTAAALVTCTLQDASFYCRDAWLELEFAYPAAWGAIAEATRRPGGYAGLAYEYTFTEGEPGVFAGGRSRDFSEGRGWMYTDQLGFDGTAPADVCARWGAALCQPVQPGVALMVLLPQVEQFCGDAMAVTATPRALIAIDLPRHPELHGFGFTASLLPPGGEADLAAQLGFAETEGPRCTPEQQAAFSERMVELRHGLETAIAPADIQARYAAALHLAESIRSPFVDAAPRTSAGCASGSDAGVQVGVPVVDAAARAICLRDAAALEALVHYGRFGCTNETALGGPPACRPGEAEGTQLDGIPVLGVEGIVVRRDEISPVFETLLARSPELLALYGDPQESYTEPGWPRAKYALAFGSGTPQPTPPLLPLTTTLLLDDAGIVRIYTEDIPMPVAPRVTGQSLVPLNSEGCPATVPNGSTPPGEQPSAFHHGNGALWTALWPGGRVLIPADHVLADGTLEMKFPWWRGTEGALTVTGRRLEDGQPLRALIPEGYGDTGIQASGLLFPAAGCWEVTGQAGETKLTFVTEVVAP